MPASAGGMPRRWSIWKGACPSRPTAEPRKTSIYVISAEICILSPPSTLTGSQNMFKKLCLAILVMASMAAIAPSAAHAQSDILLRLRSGSPLGDRMRVDSSGGVVAIGNLGIGIIPATGRGERMMWYPYRAVFLAGGVFDTQWDDGNLGFYGAARSEERRVGNEWRTGSATDVA